MDYTEILNQIGYFEGRMITESGDVMKKDPVSLQDFLLLAVLGKGSYAKVVLVKKTDTGETYAMKILKKEMITKKNQFTHVRIERDILVLPHSR